MVEVKPIDVCCSSQDPAFPAFNLVRGASKPSDERKQWLCSSPDEKLAHVTLTYEKPFVISSLEIKNNGSAYVQVEGGNSNENSGKFEVLWKSQTLMTPIESRMGTEIDGIFIFLPQDLATSDKDKMWNMLKLTCSQPFNKLQKYGLSHVIARSALPVKEERPCSPPNCGVSVPNLKWEPDVDERLNNVRAHRHQGNISSHHTDMSSEVSSSECSDASTALMSPVKQETSPGGESNLSTPRRFSEASSSSVNGIGRSSSHQHDQKTPVIKRENSVNIISDNLAGDEDTVVGDVSPRTLPGNSSLSIPLKRRMSESDSDSDSDDVQIIKRPAPSKIIYKPFNKLLEGVQIVISGFQNPLRAEIRSRALQMGATYSPHWSQSSTHLVCAFLYTPKYREAAGEGLIVSREWIDQCFLLRKRLPWRRFALNPSERSDGNGEVEIWELQPSQASTSSSLNDSISIIPPSSNERQVRSPPIQVICGNQQATPLAQNRSSSSNIISAPEIKREVPDSIECSSSSQSPERQPANPESASRQPPMQSSDSSPSQGIIVKRQINNEEQDGHWNAAESYQSHGPSPIAASTMNHVDDQSSRLQPSNPASQMSFGAPRAALSPVPCSTRTGHQALTSSASNISQMERGTDGYAGYYRPISQPCSVPHASQSAAYLVPPVIMLPQALPQYFVPVSQQFQGPSSRDTYMGQTIPSQVHGQHIRVIQPPTKSTNATNSAGDSNQS